MRYILLMIALALAGCKPADDVCQDVDTAKVNADTVKVMVLDYPKGWFRIIIMDTIGDDVEIILTSKPDKKTRGVMKFYDYENWEEITTYFTVGGDPDTTREER